ncbi:RasGEF domain-containing protein [Candidatus Protochlamydia naegleriophila]|uniref:RasGEF domain-containing protein n=1 Tax=Candidatus Protochlamydia naegleriophila TaxID=389348 RepID=A0A0U5JEL4_9BACT|nr:RasGEF domain-containing protein [Candidatus Protochlamydia naegleriophila]CUI17565.1 RasGEF domain-containing protein [Candidatus Protochlamydia naegleriophila]
MQPILSPLSDQASPSSSSTSPLANNPNFNGRHVHFNRDTQEGAQLSTPLIKPNDQVVAKGSYFPRKRALLHTQDSKLLPHFRKKGESASIEASDTPLKEKKEKKLKSGLEKELKKTSSHCIAGLISLSQTEFEQFQESYHLACAMSDEDEISSSEEEKPVSKPQLLMSIKISEDIFTDFYSKLATMSQTANLEQVVTHVLETPQNYQTVINHLKSMKQQRHLKDLRAHLFQFIASEFRKEPAPENKQALIAMTIIALEHLESNQIFVCRSLLKQLEIHSFELYVLFHKKLENFTELELLNVISANPDKQKVALATHEWLTNPCRLIGAWCQLYQSTEGHLAIEKKSNLLRFLSSFLSLPHGALPIRDYMSIRKVVNNDLLANLNAYQGLSQEVMDKIIPFIRTLSQKEPQQLTNAQDLPSPSLSNQSPSTRMYALQSQFSSRIKQASFDTCVKEFALDLQAYYANLIAPIPHAEFVSHNWTQPDHSPHFQAFLERTNAFTALVTAHILKPKTEVERALQCQFYLHSAYQSIQLGNFAGAYAILGAFNKPSIQYLHLTWESVPQESKKIKKKLEEWINPFSNFVVYRSKLEQAALKNTSNCFIPILEVYIKDLFMIDEGNPNFLADGHLNFEKLELFDTVYQSLHHHQEQLAGQQSLKNHACQFKLEDAILATINRMEEIKLATTEPIARQSTLDAYDDYLYSRFKQREPKREQPQ